VRPLPPLLSGCVYQRCPHPPLTVPHRGQPTPTAKPFRLEDWTMFRKILSYFTLPLLVFLSNSSANSASQSTGKSEDGQTATIERMIVATGNVTMDLNLDRLKGVHSEAQESKLAPFRFEVGPDSFFTIRVLNDVLRGPEPGSMGLI